MDRDTADARSMQRAIDVAHGSRSITRPNPHVGAVVVTDGQVVATGATQPPGGPHAEVVALQAAGAQARGATLVVTLEPCAHTGRTPPCTEAIISAGIQRVVVGLQDPNPRAAGGVAVLADAGIEVTTGVLADRVARQLTGFVTALSRARPHLTLKLAQDRHGTTRPSDLDRDWITGPVARTRVHDLRADADAVLVGSGTVLADDPRLTVRDAPLRHGQPRAVVFDRRGRTPVEAIVVRPGTVVVTAPDAPEDWCAALRQHGVDVLPVADATAGMAALVDRDIQSVLAEPGTTLATDLLHGDVVDRVLLHVAALPPGSMPMALALPLSDGWDQVVQRRLGPDLELEFAPTPTATTST